MTAGKTDLYVEQGATFERIFLFEQPAAGGAFEPIDITGWAFAGHMRRSLAADAFVPFTFDVLNQTTHKGKVRVRLSAAQTAAIEIDATRDGNRTPTRYLYDILVTENAAKHRRLEGAVMVSPAVTR